MEWKTSISNFDEKESNIRGFNHDELIGKTTFSEMIFLLLKGVKPTQNEAKLLDAIFVSSIEHGIAPPSIIASRSVASGGNSFNSSVAAGILALGDFHGGAIENCARILSSISNYKKTVAEFINDKKRFPGYGHKIYKDFDPRSKKLFTIAKELNLVGKYLIMAYDIEKEIEIKKGKKFCLNIDGTIAAILLDLGFDPSLGKAFFIISRTPGICAHVHEELNFEKPFRRLDKKDCQYFGPKINQY